MAYSSVSGVCTTEPLLDAELLPAVGIGGRRFCSHVRGRACWGRPHGNRYMLSVLEHLGCKNHQHREVVKTPASLFGSMDG